MSIDICRICLSQNSFLLFDLFSTQDLIENIKYCTGVDITKDDNLPQKICSSCKEKIAIACQIKRKCIESEELLRNQLEEEVIEVCIVNTESKPEKKMVRDRRQLSSYKNKRPDKSDYKCFICKRVFELIAEKNSHVREAHKNDSKVCKICNKRKPSALSFENHLRFHFFSYRFLCQHCGKNFKYKNLLEIHLKVEHSNSMHTYLCDLCGYSTKFKMNLQRHLVSFHMKVKGFVCAFDGCTAKYSTQVGLNLHLYRNHNLPAPVNCQKCQQGFTFDSEVKIHLKHCTGLPIRVKGPRENPHMLALENGFRCQICSQEYETKAKWSVHYYHKHKNSNICNICNKQLSSSTSLFKHIRVKHEKIKKYVCGFPGCARSFGFKHTLTYHQNVHTKSKPFKCNMCDFRTGDRSSMSKHKKKVHQ